MERYKVSGQELRDFYQTETQLGRVFMDIERDLKGSNQVVCQFIVNGLALQESDEPRFSIISLREVDTLEYLTEDSESLVGSVINSWIDALPELIANTEELAEHVRRAGLTGSFKAIHDLVENCEYLVGSMVSLKGMLGDTLTARNLSWPEAEKISHEAVRQAIAALETKDFVQLADILEYDLNHALQTWLECLVQLGEAFDIDPDIAGGEASAAVQTGSYSSRRGHRAH
jgi:hypothetical protein